MKSTLFVVFALCAILCAPAQEYQTRYQSATEPQTLLPINYMRLSRQEVILPNVKGYTPYKADLHMHSTHTDGVVNVKGRMEEAWCDGLDVVAMTDHLSIRPVPEYGQPTPDSAKTKRGSKAAKAVEDALKYADNFGLLVIPAVELTGDGETQGHYNALFISDVRSVYDYDPMQAIRNAREQGALIMHNHPGWRHKSLDMSDFEKAVYAEKLIDGIELMNGPYFYPRVFDVAERHKLFMTSNTDIHTTTSQVYRENGYLRNMTFIFAKELSLCAMREALEAHRTLTYAFGTIGGEKTLLEELFKASVETKKLPEGKGKEEGRQRVMLTNKSSLPYTLRVGKGNPIILRPLSSTIVTVKAGSPVSCAILNMWCGENEHPSVKLKY